MSLRSESADVPARQQGNAKHRDGTNRERSPETAPQSDLLRSARYPSGRARRRQADGGTPMTFLKARLNAASDSYPISAATLATLALPPLKSSEASCIRHLAR